MGKARGFDHSRFQRFDEKVCNQIMKDIPDTAGLVIAPIPFVVEMRDILMADMTIVLLSENKCEVTYD